MVHIKANNLGTYKIKYIIYTVYNYKFKPPLP